VKRQRDPAAIARELLAALGQSAPEVANDDDGRQVDDATIEEWATKAAEEMRARRKR
jgi:hypothetical protein